MNNIDSKVEKGQAIYSNSILKIYDWWVLSFSNTYLWKCNTKNLEQMFKQHISSNHLDVGVGTGYFLDKCLKSTNRRVVLFDLNENSLDTTQKRIKRFNVSKYKVNVLQPITVDCEKFDSISINYLIHCLPDNLNEKSILFKHISEYLNKNGIIFGSTILGKKSNMNFFAKKLNGFYNKKGIFDNNEDSLEDLKNQLEKYFDNVEIKIIGCVALFNAKMK